MDGLNKQSIRVGVWRGDLELKDLKLRPDALAVFFENLGLDLPVTVTAGHIGLLRLEVPWKSLRSAPVRIIMHDVTVVASPVSDGDQTALELREQRLKAARLATDEVVRDAKFSMGAMQSEPSSVTGSNDSDYRRKDSYLQNTESTPQGGNRVTRWGWRFTSQFVTKIVDNIQVDVENVIIQYEDASSVRSCPYTATLAFDSLRACSTNRNWEPVFLENPTSPIVHKLIYMHGLVLNWEPGNANNDLKSWILETDKQWDMGYWSGFVRRAARHAIRPMDGQLKIALAKSSALAVALSGTDPTVAALKLLPRVQMDLHFPEVNIALDDFQYHTLLSTIMYLSDIDRKVRPKTAKGRWIWALDRLLPRFKERRAAALRFNAEGLRKRRELREKYCAARNAVIRARRNGTAELEIEGNIIEELEKTLSYEDVVLFRDISDTELYLESRKNRQTRASPYSGIWSLFSRRKQQPSSVNTDRSEGSSVMHHASVEHQLAESDDEDILEESVRTQDSADSSNSLSNSSPITADGVLKNEALDQESEEPNTEDNIPNIRIGFHLQRGAIELKEGGHSELPIPVASLEFHELRLGIETGPQAGFLLEALLGTFQVVDVRRNIKVMYPRVPWAGEGLHSNTDLSGIPADALSHLPEANEDSRDAPISVSHTELDSKQSMYTNNLQSYPYGVVSAIGDIRGEYRVRDDARHHCDTAVGMAECESGSSSTSLSGLSDDTSSPFMTSKMDELFAPPQTPLRYIAALRLSQEEAPEGEWAKGATRMAMDLAIGGMEVLVGGPQGAFISAVSFWHPREKMPSIMQFLSRAAAPRLASLRMDIQKALLERSVPMRMDLLIRGPRFVIPCSTRNEISLVLDFGTFAMETSVEAPHSFTADRPEETRFPSESRVALPLTIRYTNYKMAATDLGLYVVSDAGKRNAERIIRPFSVHLLLQVLNNASYVEAMTRSLGKVDLAKVKLQGKLPSLRTSVSYDAFRHILDIVKGWGERSSTAGREIGIEPNTAKQSMTVSPELEDVRLSHETTRNKGLDGVALNLSPLVGFEMGLEFQHLQLDLKDPQARPIVTISSSGTALKLKKRSETVDFSFSVKHFLVLDGSRGATAPFRQLAYAGTENMTEFSGYRREDARDPNGSEDDRAFIVLAYQGDLTNHEQSLAVRILSLNLLCVRETYFALADFFYLKRPRRRTKQMSDSGLSNFPPQERLQTTTCEDSRSRQPVGEEPEEYSDPFNALGMTTSGAARALREQAGRGMEFSKQAFADRGKLALTADLDGLNITLVTAEGAIARFDMSNFSVNLTQFSNGAVSAMGQLGGFGVRDLTSAFDVYSEAIRYNRDLHAIGEKSDEDSDCWVLNIPESSQEDIWLEAHLRNVRIVYLHRFIVILKKYFDVMRESLKPVLEMKGGIAEVFSDDQGAGVLPIQTNRGRIRLNVTTENVDVVMPRHSQSPYEALRFIVEKSSITNQDFSAPGYRLGVQIEAIGVNAYVLYQPPAEGEGRALTPGGTDPILRQISPTGPVTELVPFSENICIVAKLDAWRHGKVPEVILNAEGIPVLKDGEEEREYDPAKWLPAIRVRISAPSGIVARLCEAEYSILYFTFTENVIERPDIEFTDIVRGLKTPVLPARKPIQPIMFSSNRMPPNYQILFEVPIIDSIIMSGGDPCATSTRLIRTRLQDLLGFFEYGVDYRMTIEVNANVHSLEDARPYSSSLGVQLITPIQKDNANASQHADHTGVSHTAPFKHEMTRSVTLTWDRPFGFRANVMVVLSDLRIVVDPELFRDLGALTAPGFPFLKSSAPPPLLRFNGRLLILTLASPEVWLLANQYPGDGRSLVIRGDVIAKVQWAAVTGRNFVEVAAKGIRINLSNTGPFKKTPSSPVLRPLLSKESSLYSSDGAQSETPMLYPADVSMRFEGRGYDPPENINDEPIKAPGSALHITAESFLMRLDVNDTPLLLAVGSRVARLKPSNLSRRPVQPGRFDQWIDKSEDGDAKLEVHFVLPQSRLMFTDETAGRYVPIMEARVRNATVKTNVPWLMKAGFEFALDLFNEEKGWWEPGIECFPAEIATSKGRSGSQAIHITVDRNLDVNVTPNTVSGAARVSRALKASIEDLKARLRKEEESPSTGAYVMKDASLAFGSLSSTTAQRPSVAAFCVKNETGRSMTMWLPYDSKRRSLRGNGEEIEIETPSEELLWTAMSAAGSVTSDPNRNRRVSMSCVLSLSGYESLTLSTEHTGNKMVYFVPDTRELNSPAGKNRSSFSPLPLVWAVSMRDGVPCGCIRSVMRLVNRTRTLLEVSLGGLQKSMSAASETSMNMNAKSSIHDADRPVHSSVKPNEAWCIPVHAVHRDVRIRPALFHAPESEDDLDNDEQERSPLRGRVHYSYRWSDPLSKISMLHEEALKTQTDKRNCTTTSSTQAGDIRHPPILSCKSEDGCGTFCLALDLVVDSDMSGRAPNDEMAQGWLDVNLCAPLILINFLPRPLYYKLAKPRHLRRVYNEHVFEKGCAQPLREVQVHGVGSDIGSIALAVGMDNSSIPGFKESSGVQNQRHFRKVGSFHLNLPNLKEVSTGAGKYMPLKVSLEQEQSNATRVVKLYSQFWIRNRSDTDIFFRDREFSRNNSFVSPKVFLRGRPLETTADPFVCFSGHWLSLQKADTTQDKWLNIDTEVSEIDKPLPISLDSASLVLEVRPARGKFHNALVVTVRNAAWLENKTGSIIQWCQTSALNSKGVALSSKVHTILSGQSAAIHWDFHTPKKSICLRRASADGSSEWIWSRPVNVEGLQGEFAAKMYRPKREEQYIARVVVSRLHGGVSAITIHREDRNTPPYRIVNRCADRAIAFRQSGVSETLPWLVRPGRASRYSWDDPQAPVKKRFLLVEVIEPSPTQTASDTAVFTSHVGKVLLAEPALAASQSAALESGFGMKREKFELKIDVVGDRIPYSHAKKFSPGLLVSVHVDGPTKVVTFRDERDPKGGLNARMGRNLDSSEKTETILAKSTSKRALQSAKSTNVDIVLYVKALGVSFVESAPVELAYLSVTGFLFRLDRFDGQQLVECQVQDLQLDNQLVYCTWPVVLWSPPPLDASSSQADTRKLGSGDHPRRDQKPFFQLTLNGPYPAMNNGIMSFHGIFLALQQLQIAADEDFVLRVWLFAVSLVDAAGGPSSNRDESLNGYDGYEKGLSCVVADRLGINPSPEEGQTLLNRLYVESLELCPLKFSISFTSSRTSTAAEQIGGFRSLMRTLVAVLGNVENAEFRFNALELDHVFDTTSHFFSLIGKYYMSQVSNQKMVLLASNSLIGNPSALFDSIAIGTRDFFVEPANAKGSAAFIASLGRGSSSLLTNTVGGLVGSLGGIPRAVAQGLETAVGDREYLAERDSIRGGRARIVSSPAQGLFTGALSFGHGIASGAAGLIRDPIQGAAEEGPSGFLKGLGKGFIGGVLKPITGALDLIAEPAAGFRSMMVSHRSQSIAEPARPPRAFRGSSANQMATYNIETALGQAILDAINRSENNVSDERLLAWTHLVGISSSATNDEVISFLWALMRRSTRSSNLQSKYLLDAHGNPQRAEKMRAGLVTSKRVIISSLDGHILWEHPLRDVVDTQVSLEAKDFLMIGVRPVGHNSRAVIAPTWKKIHCGSMLCRDELNSAIKKALEDLQTAWDSGVRSLKTDATPGDDNSILLQDLRRDRRRDGSVELVDMSTNSNMTLTLGNAVELKSLHQDASVDGRRGVFTSMKLPGRDGDVLPKVVDNPEELPSVSQQLQKIAKIASHRKQRAVRSVRVLVANQTDKCWTLVKVTVESGRWVLYPPKVIDPQSAVYFEADGTDNRVKDVSGSAIYCLKTDTGLNSSELLAVRFLNPLLAGNAYTVQVPNGFNYTRTGGEKGDHAVTMVMITSVTKYEPASGKISKEGRIKSAAEPLLFGRSKVSPYLPPVNFFPPHAEGQGEKDAEHSELIGKLCSLGFSDWEARDALDDSDLNLSEAYSKLLEMKEGKKVTE